MKRYIVAATAGLVLLVIAVTILLAKFPVPISIEIKLPPAATKAASGLSASSAPALPSPEEQGLRTPEAFLAAIYKHYEVNDPDDHFSTLNIQSDYYDPELSAIMEENDRLYDGYIGALEADPICQCRDCASITTNIRIVSQDANSAKAVATLTQAPGGKPYTVKYELVRIDGRWRIHDLGSDNYPSMRAEYQKSNEDARRHPAENAGSS